VKFALFILHKITIRFSAVSCPALRYIVLQNKNQLTILAESDKFRKIVMHLIVSCKLNMKREVVKKSKYNFIQERKHLPGSELLSVVKVVLNFS